MSRLAAPGYIPPVLYQTQRSRLDTGVKYRYLYPGAWCCCRERWLSASCLPSPSSVLGVSACAATQLSGSIRPLKELCLSVCLMACHSLWSVCRILSLWLSLLNLFFFTLLFFSTLSPYSFCFFPSLPLSLIPLFSPAARNPGARQAGPAAASASTSLAAWQ